MKVLFVCSGNSIDGISPIIKNQGDFLSKAGCLVDYFTIKGKGLRGYIAAVPVLRKKAFDGNYDIIHAHYSLSALVAILAGVKPIVISLMGSDVFGEYIGLKKSKAFKSLFDFGHPIHPTICIGHNLKI